MVECKPHRVDIRVILTGVAPISTSRFEDFVLLNLSPWKGAIRFLNQGRLGPRYIGPFRVVARGGKGCLPVGSACGT